MSLSQPTRGESYNNPGDIEDFGIPWKGMTGVGAGNLCIYATRHDGLRALALDLLNAQRKHGLRTIAEIVPRYAPAKDHNDVPAYIAAVAHEMACSPTRILNLADPPTLRDLVTCFIMHEQGRCIYTVEEVVAVVTEVLGVATII
jgi:hypothetical protein